LNICKSKEEKEERRKGTEEVTKKQKVDEPKLRKEEQWRI